MAEPTHATSISESPFTLQALIGTYAQRLKQGADAHWVAAEVAKMSTSPKGHVYLDLVEHDGHGREVAKVRATLWASQAAPLLAKFRAATGTDPRDGIKVLLNVQPELNPQYGFSLKVRDLDPSYTLGDMQRKLAAIRETLSREGVFGANRALAEPTEFTRVAVLAPPDAAGLGDFMRDADVLARAGLCRFDVYSAPFQGAAAPHEIRRALTEVLTQHATVPYDVLAIIRGGGAITDLNWLNDLALARAVCVCPLPVFTGIGHERDSVILDEVACRSFGTPSKVIGHIRETIRGNAAAGEDAWLAIHTRAEAEMLRVVGGGAGTLAWVRGQVAELIGEVATLAERQYQVVYQAAESALVHADQAAGTSYQSTRSGATEALEHARYSAQTGVDAIRNGAHSATDRQHAVAEMSLQSVQAGAHAALESALYAAGAAMERLRASGGWMAGKTLGRAELAVQSIQGSAVTCLDAARYRARADLDAIRTTSLETAGKFLGRIELSRQDLNARVGAQLARVTQDSSTQWQRVQDQSERALDAAAQTNSLTWQMVEKLGPEATVARGYAILRDARDRILMTAAEIGKTPASAVLQLRDGRIAVTLNPLE